MMTSVSPTPVETTARTTLGLPVERFEQLKSLAKARDIAPAALVEEWITRAVTSGEPGAIELPGYSAWKDDDVVIAEIAHRTLPFLPIEQALKLSMALDAAAPTGSVNMKGDFTLSIGAGLALDLGEATLAITRKGRGVVFVLTEKPSGVADRFSAPTSYVADLARMIREAIATH